MVLLMPCRNYRDVSVFIPLHFLNLLRKFISLKTNFLFVSAENDGIPNCKAGGMGDVVRDVPRQIASRGDQVHVVTPSYGRLHQNGRLLQTLEFFYRGQPCSAELYEVNGKRPDPLIRHYVVHHPDIKSGDIAHIYFNDNEQPFYTDACTFSLFCVALAEGIYQGCFGKVDIAHLHDWHTSLLLFLKQYHLKYKEVLGRMRWVYSIHNLAIQGIRPFEQNYASLSAFFPEVKYDQDRLKDERYPDCINLMALGIRMADAVHTVSPSYMEDVQQPSNPPGFIGGEGLEDDLRKAAAESRLYGILNGCNYQNIRQASKGMLWKNVIHEHFVWLQESTKKYKSDFLAHTGAKISRFLFKEPAFMCASVARLTEQKFYFFKADPSVLESMLHVLEAYDGVFVLLGTGAPEYESLFREISHRFDNFIFINAQSEDVIDSLYLEADLYVMPSLFEPCGISQMLAMRNGVPCFVHHTGGLKDTVRHGVTGFSFSGATFEDQKRNMVRVFKELMALHQEHPEQWEQISLAASKERFSWENSVDQYYSMLYKR